MIFLNSQEKKISIYFILLILFFIYFDYSIAIFFHQINSQTKSIFTTLTQFGDSLYYFVPIVLTWLVLKIINSKNNYLKTLSDICLFLFWNILISGVLVQIFKHILARPRPVLFFNSNQTSLDFFSFESQLHSFPSGHSATVFAFAFSMLLLFPRLKSFWLIFASIIALTRVIITAHFVSDIIAGAFVSYLVSIYLKKYFLDREKLFHQVEDLIKPNKEVLSFFNMIKKLYLNIFSIYLGFNFYWRFITITLLISIVFFVFPNLDITFSGLFFSNDNQFIASEKTWFIYFVRKMILPLMALLSFFIPLAAIIKHLFYKEKILNICVRDWLYFFSCLILGTGIIVNSIFKNLWGRARPNDTIVFGGDQPFSIPWLNVEYCDTNCSFVSGDVSFFTLSLALLIIFNKTSWNIFAYILIVVVSILRIMEGDHFLSDTLMSFIITYLVIKVLHSIFKKMPEDMFLNRWARK